MQIECPSCGAAYEVPDTILARRRRMRCARCAHDWLPALAEPAFAPAPDPVQEAPAHLAVPLAAPAPEVPAARASISRRRKAAVLAAWAASIVVLALLGWTGIEARARIVHAWPPSARLYAALRLR